MVFSPRLHAVPYQCRRLGQIDDVLFSTSSEGLSHMASVIHTHVFKAIALLTYGILESQMRAARTIPL